MRHNTGQSDPMQAGTLGGVRERCRDGGIDSIAVLPDGSALYATASESDGVVVFERAADGTISQRPGTAGCITETGFEDADLSFTEGVCQDGRALLAADGVIASEDGKHVYTTARFGGVDTFDVVAPPAPEPPAAKTPQSRRGRARVPERQGQGPQDRQPAQEPVAGKRAPGPQGHVRDLRSGQRPAQQSRGSRSPPGQRHEARPSPSQPDGQGALRLSAARVQCFGHAHRLGRSCSLRAPIPRARRQRARQPRPARDGAAPGCATRRGSSASGKQCRSRSAAEPASSRGRLRARATWRARGGLDEADARSATLPALSPPARCAALTALARPALVVGSRPTTAPRLGAPPPPVRCNATLAAGEPGDCRERVARLGGGRVLHVQAEARNRGRSRPGAGRPRRGRAERQDPGRRQRRLGRRDGRSGRSQGWRSSTSSSPSSRSRAPRRRSRSQRPTSIPIAADEKRGEPREAERAVELAAWSLTGVKLAKVGGTEAAIEIAGVLPAYLSSALEGPVGIAAAAQVARR